MKWIPSKEIHTAPKKSKGIKMLLPEDRVPVGLQGFCQCPISFQLQGCNSCYWAYFVFKSAVTVAQHVRLEPETINISTYSFCYFEIKTKKCELLQKKKMTLTPTPPPEP